VRVFALASGSDRLIGADLGRLEAIVFLTDGRLVVGSETGVLGVWDPMRGEVRTYNGHTTRMLDLAASPDGRRVVSMSVDRSLRVWDLASGESWSRIEGASRARFFPDGKRFLTVHAFADTDDARRLTIWRDDLPFDPAELAPRLNALSYEIIGAGGDWNRAGVRTAKK
jgi:WD40 repeat protein